MRRIAIAGLGALMSVAALAARADDQSRLSVAREVVKAAHVGDAMRQLLPAMMNQMRPMLAQQGASDPKLVDAFITRFSARSDAEVENFVDLSAQVYAREFSEGDLTNLLNFYKSPSGQVFVSKQPEIAKAMVAVGAKWGQGMAKQVLEEYLNETKGSAPKL